jgi:hypothetical protein
MRTVIQYVGLISPALIAFGVASPRALAAQLISARPASVGLTVVVPPRVQSEASVVSQGNVSFLRTTPTAIDLETTVGLLDRPVTRVELRLAAAWSAESTDVWVQNYLGEFERLLRDDSIVALDAPLTVGRSRAPLRLRVESTPRRLASPIVIPLEYRLTVGSGDRFSVWSFSSLLRIEAEH